MSETKRPKLQEPLTQLEIDRLRVRSRLAAAALIAFPILVSAYSITQLGSPLTFFFSLLILLNIIAFGLAWEVASEMWKKYSALPKENCASANHLFGQRRELEAYRQAIRQMGRPFVWADYWTASQFHSALSFCEVLEEKRKHEEDECKKLYGI